MFGGFVLAGLLAFGMPKPSWKWPHYMLALSGMILAAVGLFDVMRFLRADTWSFGYVVLERTRTFHGVVTVADRDFHDERARDHALYSGRILHGVQFTHPDQRHWPTTYYAENSGVGQAMGFYRRRGQMRVGMIGLGVGTLAAYADLGDYLRFYEINPEVPRLARKFFTYLADAEQRGATVEIVLGDARLSLERELLQGRPQRFDLLVLDAFSGDAIPNHLLTMEAFEIYLPHLADDGALVVHISNKYLNLAPVVYGLAEHFGLSWVRIESPEDHNRAVSSPDWVIISRNQELLDALRPLAVRPDDETLPAELPLWTDQRHNLIEILR
jgi:hypothetical protein